jgi:hypothetical protein
MRRFPFAVFLVAGLAAPAALAATPQAKWTAKGPITALQLHSITVNGKSCRITTASPARPTLRLYYVGAEAKIACADGVLRKIDVLNVLPSIKITSPQPGTGGGNFGTASVSISQTGVITSTSGAVAFAAVPVSAIGNGSITVGTGPVNLTCTIGEGSPDISGLQVGNGVTSMRCQNGVLTSIARAPQPN